MEVLILIPKETYNTCNFSGLKGGMGSGSPDPTSLWIQKSRESVEMIDAPKYTQQKKLRKSQKTMQHKFTKANNYSIFIYLFRYMSSVEKNVYFSLLAPISLLWHSVK